MNSPINVGAKQAPGPRPQWIVGNLLQQRKVGFVRFYESLVEQYGDLVRFRFGPLVVHLISRPEDIDHVLLRHKDKYEKGIGVERLKLIMGNGLFLSEGDFWKSQRKLMQPPFTPRGVQAFADSISGSVARLTDRLEKAQKENAPVDVQMQMMQLALDVISQSMFGVYLDAEVNEMARSFSFILDYVSESASALIDIPLFIPTPKNNRFKRARADVMSYVRKLINERKKRHGEQDDLLTRLLNATDEQNGKGMSEDQLLDEVITLFFAGHETTAQALTWLWYLLSQNPGPRAKLEAELDSVLGGRAPTLDDLHHLPYTRAVVDESMRVFPPIWTFVRQSLVEDEIRGYRIDKGSMMMIAPYITHRMPEFFPDPQVFRPERFLPGAEPKIPPHAYLPFGGGPRICIGNNFALLEMVMTVAAVAQKFHLTPTTNEPVLPEPMATLRLNRALLANVEPRA
jgi:cytochrome P450